MCCAPHSRTSSRPVGTSATGLQGKEGELLRLVLKWSIGLTVVVLQAYVLKFMVP
jgi:L-lactate permease